MKTLESYINEMHIEDDILKRIYFHTCIEFKLPHNLYPYIVESNGKFDNAGNVVKHIIDTLKKDFRSQIIDVRDDHVYFDYIDKRFSTIKKELYNNWIKFEKKFEQLVPRLVCQYIDTNLREVCFDNSLLDEETYWDNLI